MKAARVVGRVVATKKDPTVNGKKILMLEPMEWEDVYKKMKRTGKDRADGTRGSVRSVIALDSVGAGSGEYVFYVSSKEACQAFGNDAVCHNAVIGIIDGISIDGPDKSTAAGGKVI